MNLVRLILLNQLDEVNENESDSSSNCQPCTENLVKWKI